MSDAIWSNHPDVIALAHRAYPDYNGHKFRVSTRTTINVRSSWDGGTRSWFKFIRLDGTDSTVTVPDQSAFDPRIQGADAVPLVPGLACVEHTVFCGKDMGIRIHVHPENAPRLLPAPSELSEDELTVLMYTAHLKNSYGGRTNIRYTRAHAKTGITVERWDAAKALLVNKKLLLVSGAITGEGRNAVPHGVCL
jgi:hypothetical protein